MQDFLALFTEQEGSETMKNLAKKQFEEELWIADGLYLSANSADALQYFIRNEEKRKKYEEQFLIFGKATHSGSLYAFYKKPGAKSCDEWPVLVLGDEGGAVALAKNLKELLRFWTLNSVQPYINSSDYRGFDLFADASIDEDEECSNQDYKNWIEQSLGLQALQSIEQAENEIIQPAINEYQELFDSIFGEE